MLAQFFLSVYTTDDVNHKTETNLSIDANEQSLIYNNISYPCTK